MLSLQPYSFIVIQSCFQCFSLYFYLQVFKIESINNTVLVLKRNISISAPCFSYSIIGGNSQFTINPSTGQIITSALLDRETKDNYTLVVVSSDAGSPVRLSSSASVFVTVTDVNDNPPRFQHHPYVTHIPSPTLPGNQPTLKLCEYMKIVYQMPAFKKFMYFAHIYF